MRVSRMMSGQSPWWKMWSVSQISQQSVQLLSPVQEEGLAIDNDLHIQGPLDSCGTTDEAPPMKSYQQKSLTTGRRFFFP